jgi:hypothetical protein
LAEEGEEEEEEEVVVRVEVEGGTMAEEEPEAMQNLAAATLRTWASAIRMRKGAVSREPTIRSRNN